MKDANSSPASLADVGQKLLVHSKQAKFTARGVVVELFPFIYGASERMSARDISRFLEKEQGVKLSSVTITRALKDPGKTWNLFFDMIEPAARTYVKGERVTMSVFLFKKNPLFKPFKSKLFNATLRAVFSDEVAVATSILRAKWFTIDLGIRLKARPYFEHRLDK